MIRPSALLWLAAAPAALLPLTAVAVTPDEVAQTYVAIAEATFGDALTTGQALQAAVDAFVAAPSDETLQAARAAWVAARVPYQRSEVFRFANPVVDDWEGRVNSWPLDEGFIDYVAEGTAENEENDLSALDIVANPALEVAGEPVSAAEITPELLASLHGAEENDANVATGYHAIEFLLWGQDLNGTEAGAGARPFTDYVVGAGCTGGNCDRRAAYLAAASALLVTDLQEQVAAWAEGGAGRARILEAPENAVLATLTGIGSLSYGELAGERMKLGLLLNDPEEEQDCFSDNTHNSHYNDGVGMQGLYLGRYTRVDGSLVEGPSVSAYLAERDAAVDAELTAGLEASVAALAAIKARAEGGMAYDQMLAPGNAEGAALLETAIAALVAQTASVERAVKVAGLGPVTIEGSDSLDNPSAVGGP